MGQSDTFCSSFRVSGKGMGISCTDGVITSFTHFGVYAKNSEADDLDICATGLNVDTGIQGCDTLSSQESSFYK